MTVVLNDQEIMLRIGRNREKGSVIGTDQVKLGVWQHLLIDLGSVIQGAGWGEEEAGGVVGGNIVLIQSFVFQF